jgi:hypothetical protein
MANLSKEEKKRDKKFWKNQIWNQYKIGKDVKESTWCEKQDIKTTWKDYILIQSAFIEYVMEENAAEWWDEEDPLVTLESYYNFLGGYIEHRKNERKEYEEEEEQDLVGPDEAKEEYLRAKASLIKRYENKQAEKKETVENRIGFRLPN